MDSGTDGVFMRDRSRESKQESLMGSGPSEGEAMEGDATATHERGIGGDGDADGAEEGGDVASADDGEVGDEEHGGPKETKLTK